MDSGVPETRGPEFRTTERCNGTTMRASARLRIGEVRMVWEPEIEELARRRALSAKGGTPDRIERQHNQGRLVVR